MDNILIPIDFSDLTDLAVEQVIPLGKAFGSMVRVLHVAPPEPSFASSKSWPQEVRDEMAKELHTEHSALETLAQRLQESGLQAKAIMARGDVTDTILEVAERTHTNLIVLGSHQHGAFYELLPRSIIKGVLRRAACPVMVVPSHRAGATS